MSTAFFDRHSRWRPRALLLPLPVLLLAWQAGCGDSSKLSCGPGTERKGDECVAKGDGTGGTGGDGESPDGGTDPGPVANMGGGGNDDGPPPVAEMGPQFAGINSTSPASDVAVQVTWEPAEDTTTPASDIVYRVYVATKSGNQNFAKPSVTSPPGASSALVGNLEPDTDYYFVVRAVNAAGLEDQNEVELVGTPTVDDEAPEFDGVKHGEPAGAAAVKLSWSPATDDHTAPEGISYVVRWATSEAGATVGTVTVQTAPGATSVIVKGLPEPSTKYFFNVTAQDAAGNVDGNSVAREFKTGDDETPPHFVGCTGATDPGATTALISWDVASDDTTPADKITYNVYAFTKGVDDDTAFGNPVGSFVGGSQGRVDGLSTGTDYSFVCRAQDISGNEDENLAFRTLSTKDDGDPPDFDGIVDAVVDSTSAVLSWDAAKDPGEQTPAGEIVYLIYQSENPEAVFEGQPVAVSNPGVTNIKLTGLKSATTYYWGVRAQDKAQNVDANEKQKFADTLVSLALDIQPILSRYCVKSGCHSPSNPPQGLNMDVGFAYFNLVGVTAIELPTLKRILPGAPEKSYVINKLHGTQIQAGGSGQQMPPVGNEAPTEANILLIEKWIQQGAGNN